jgi:hypothetical protein
MVLRKSVARPQSLKLATAFSGRDEVLELIRINKGVDAGQQQAQMTTRYYPAPTGDKPNSDYACIVHFRHHDALEHPYALGGEYGDIYTK